MGVDNGVGIDYQSGGWAGQREQRGGIWDNCNGINNLRMTVVSQDKEEEGTQTTACAKSEKHMHK